MPDGPWKSFDIPMEALVPLAPIVRWEHDKYFPKFMCPGWDIPPGMLLQAVLPPSALRYQVHKLHPLEVEQDFVADFCLPFFVASSQPLELQDGRWELDISI